VGVDRTAPPSPYELAQRQGQDVLRRTLLDAASRLLVTEGPQALTMRRVASAVGEGAMSVYLVHRYLATV